jgi:flagellar biosynthesis protein FlgN
MTNAAQCVKTLLQDMVEDRKLYVSLNGMLEHQREHIISRHVPEMDALNAQVMDIYQQLSSHGQRRYQLLSQLGIPADASGMQTLLSRLPDAHKTSVTTLWNDLQQQAQKCQSANEYNGTLINMQQDILANLVCVSEPESWLYNQI